MGNIELKDQAILTANSLRNMALKLTYTPAPIESMVEALHGHADDLMRALSADPALPAAAGSRQPYCFDRYRNGVRMAEGAKIYHAATAEEAEAKARKLFEQEESYPWSYTGPCTDEFRLRDSQGERPRPAAGKGESS